MVRRACSQNQHPSADHTPTRAVSRDPNHDPAPVPANSAHTHPHEQLDPSADSLLGQSLVKAWPIDDHSFRFCLRRRVGQLVSGRRVKSSRPMFSEYRFLRQDKPGEGFGRHKTRTVNGQADLGVFF